MNGSPPVIGFELGVGEFRIVTPEAVYEIRVLPELVKANTQLGVISQAAQMGMIQGAPVPALPAGQPLPALGVGAKDEPAFFQELSQELFGRIGQLARQLSISVTELPDSPPDQGALSRSGQDLEDAKGQLEEVVEITEKASIQIMDLADSIQADVDNLNKQMGVLNNLEFLLDPADGAKDAPPVEGEKPQGQEEGGSSGEFLDKFKELKAFVETLPKEIKIPGASVPQEAAPAAAPAEPPAPATTIQKVTKVTFDLEIVFQTLYEFCTNEAVKDHIKEMRADFEAGGFDNEKLSADLTAMAETVGEDEGLYNFPLPNLLKLLHSHTQSEKNRATLKKMNQTVASIFLDNVLPLEGQKVEVEVEVPAEPASAPAPEPAPAPVQEASEGESTLDLSKLPELVGELDQLIATGAGPSGGAHPGGGFTCMRTSDRDAIVAAVAASDKLIKNTTSHLTHIMEALSFQDLSGQRIKKIVGLIGEIQVQLLSLLVSVDTKIKAHHDSQGAPPPPKEETEKVAQAEVDKMLEKLSGETSEMKGPGAENRLDQGAVNDLLSQLGF
ncbi:MAG: protein phosphatase CheZ [Deltaproteobacteria bacterium]|jgi:chemotaxis regulatin CheY-phosphate phosphatase CheZ|nr:protein phosphatase CheZ [Deltaproteobacteria bacterium]